jgi:hypothetical protein
MLYWAEIFLVLSFSTSGFDHLKGPTYKNKNVREEAMFKTFIFVS